MGKALVPARGVAIAGRYVLERHLGRGGMGAVWLAQTQRGDRVAIKLMAHRHVMSAEFVERFEREAKAVERLSSLHVVRVIEHGLENDTPFLVMEWVDGEDLMERLDRETKLSAAVTLDIAKQIGFALSHAHSRGVIHRDLKPENVMLTHVNDALLVKLLDFGLAKVSDETRLTQTNTAMGSPRYMSPEQARSAGRVDHRSDLWSLAVVLFRCLSGAPIFDGENAATVLAKVCYEPIPLASDIAPEMTPAMDRFFRKALQRDVDRRFATVEELITAFEHALFGGDAEPPVAERSLTEDVVDDSTITRGWSLRDSTRSSVTWMGGAIAAGAGLVALGLVLAMGEDLEATARSGLSDAANRIALATVMARPEPTAEPEPEPPSPPPQPSVAEEPTATPAPRRARPRPPPPPPQAAPSEPNTPAWGF